MYFDLLMLTLGFVGLTVGTITDLQKREVADWVTHVLIFAGLGIRLLYSVDTGEWVWFIAGVIAVVAAYAFSIVMYYTGQWGGGDAKMLMGLAALHATYVPVAFTPMLDVHIFSWLAEYNASFLVALLINIFIAGSVYGIVWMIVQLCRQWREIEQSYHALLGTYKTSRMFGGILAIACLVCSFFVPLVYAVLFVVVAMVIALLLYLRPLLKAVEDKGMLRHMAVKDLTEGEWVAEDVFIGGKCLAVQGTTLTQQHLDSIDTTPEQTVTVRFRKFLIPFVKTLPLSQVEDTMTIVRPVTIRKKTFVGRLSKKDLFAFMTAKIKEQSRFSVVKGKKIHFSSLQVGDVIDQDLYPNRIPVISEQNLGIDRYQIALLQKYRRKPVLVKIGIPFLPAFWIGYVITIVWGNLVIGLWSVI